MGGELELRDLAPDPQEEWHRLLRFVGWNEEQRAAAARSVEVLFRRGPELVAETYAYLAHVPETAAVLAWEMRIDEAHLEERRRFFTVWLARTLGLDTSDEFAGYLFRAGAYHAGRGPRQVHVPPEYVTGSIGLVQASFVRFMAESGMEASRLAAASGAWSTYLAVQLDLMLLGYRVARELVRGATPIHCAVFGRLRSLVDGKDVVVHADTRETVGDVLRKLLNAYPRVRAEALDRVWYASDEENGLWEKEVAAYVPRPGWRVLLNGRDLRYDGGFQAAVTAGDELALFPPGR